MTLAALAAHEAELAAARERLDAALADIAALSDEQREQALADVDIVHGRYSIDGHRLRSRTGAGSTRRRGSCCPAMAGSAG